jgi:hypothetical protein
MSIIKRIYLLKIYFIRQKVIYNVFKSSELALPIGILGSNELPVPLEGFLPPAAMIIRTSSASPTTKMADNNSTTTQRPTMQNATAMTTTTLPPLILQPVSIQPEGPVVLPESLGDCADGHEKFVPNL